MALNRSDAERETTEPYIHETLGGADHFRILRLLPSVAGESEVRCALVVESLSTFPQYEALSYAWGEPDFVENLYIDAGIFKITPNLHAGLVALRHSDKPRNLWIDAVCINQRDLEEKSAQVSKMADIYKNAERVIVWLGPQTGSTRPAFVYLTALSEQAESLDFEKVSGASYWCGHPDFSAPATRAEQIVRMARETGIEDVYGRLWFTRMWVVQEVFLAKDIIIACGEQSLSWEDFATATLILFAAIRKYGTRQWDMLSEAWELVRTRAERLMTLHPAFLQIDSYQAYAEMLTKFAHLSCSDDRDRIYALLSLADTAKPIEVNYSKSIAAVYTDFYVQYGNLGMLFEAGLCNRDTRDASDPSATDPLHPDYLPSWVPELRQQSIRWAPVFSGSFGATSVVRGMKLWAKESPQRLVIQALRFDAVETVLSGLGTEDSEAWEPRQEFLDLTAILNNLKDWVLSLPDGYPTMESGLSVVAQTAVGGLPEYLRISVSQLLYDERDEDDDQSDAIYLMQLWEDFDNQCLKQHGELRRLMSDEEPQFPEYDALTSDAKRALQFQVCCLETMRLHNVMRTKKSYVGLAPPGTAAGDEVVVIQGCRQPSVVRRVPGSTEFLLIGPCYLHGVMEGETYSSGAIDNVEWLALI